MCTCYVLKNISANSYIELDKNSYRTTNKKDKATLFYTQEQALGELNKLPNAFKKFHFVQKTDDQKFNSKMYFQTIFAKEITSENKVEENFSSDKDNQYTYLGETSIEKNNSDVPEKLIELVHFISELRRYVENLKYLERELDLKILDVRHYMRANQTKLGTVHMSKIGYYLQELERERETCKRNRLCCSIFSDDPNEFLKTSNIKEIENICNSKYRYRRIDENFFDIIMGKSAPCKSTLVSEKDNS